MAALPFRTVLVPTDFSACSDEALLYAVRLSRLHGAAVTLLHVSEVPHGVGLDARIVPKGHTEPVRVEQHLRDETRERMRRQTARVLGEPVTALDVAFGPPADTIVAVARARRADLVVMGTHGRTGLSHFLLGSVAEHVVRAAPCPVLVVRPEGHEHDDLARTPEEVALDDELTG